MSTAKKRLAPKPPQAGNGKSPADNGHSVKVDESMDEANGNGGDQGGTITLKVVLPDQTVDEMSVASSTPLMDLRMQLCAKYKLSPSFHALEPIDIKTGHTIPHQPSSTLHSTSASAVALKSKQKEPPKIITPKVVQQTVRLTVKMSRSRQQVLRVSPSSPLSDMMPQIFSKSGVKSDVQKFFELRHPDQHDMALDTSRCLDDYKIREAFLADKREAAPTSPPPTTPTTKKSKRLKSFFRLSSKKRQAPRVEAQESKDKSGAADAESNQKSVPAPKAPPRSKVQAPVPAARTHVTGKKKAPVPPSEVESQTSKERPPKPSRKQPERPPAPNVAQKAEESLQHQEENSKAIDETPSEQSEVQSSVPEQRQDEEEQDGDAVTSNSPEPAPVSEKPAESSPAGEKIDEEREVESHDYEAVEALDEVLQQAEDDHDLPGVDTERRSPSPVADEQAAEEPEKKSEKKEVEEPREHAITEEDRISVEEVKQTVDQVDLEQAPEVQSEVVEVPKEKVQQETISQEESIPPPTVEEAVPSPPPADKLSEDQAESHTEEVAEAEGLNGVDEIQSSMMEDHAETKDDLQLEKDSVILPPEVPHQEEEKLPDDLPPPPPDSAFMAEDSQTTTEEPQPDAYQAGEVDMVMEKMKITEELSIDTKTDEQPSATATPPPTPRSSVFEAKEEIVVPVHHVHESASDRIAELIAERQMNQSTPEPELRHHNTDSGISSPENTPQAPVVETAETVEKIKLEAIELPDLAPSPPPEKVETPANDQVSSDEEKTLQEIERLKEQINRIRHKKATKEKAEEEAKKKPYTILTEKRPVTDSGVPKTGTKTFTFVPNQHKKVVYEDYDSVHLGVNFSESGEISGIGANIEEESKSETVSVATLQEVATERSEAKNSVVSKQPTEDQQQKAEPCPPITGENLVVVEKTKAEYSVHSSNASGQVQKAPPSASKMEPTVVIRRREETDAADAKDSNRKSSLPHYYKRFLGMNAFSKTAPSGTADPTPPSKTAEKPPTATNAFVAEEDATSPEKSPPVPAVATNGSAVLMQQNASGAGGHEKEIHIISSTTAVEAKPSESVGPVASASQTESKAPRSPTSPVTPSFYGVSSARPFKSAHSGVPKFRPVSSSFKAKSVKEVETKPT